MTAISSPHLIVSVKRQIENMKLIILESLTLTFKTAAECPPRLIVYVKR